MSNNNDKDITKQTSSMSINTHSTTKTTTIIHKGSSTMSVHSTHESSIEVTSTTTSGGDDEDILSIENTLEQVATTQNETSTTRTRAGFNSISDTLGNLRSRLHHHTSRSSSSNRRSGILQRLQERLHTIDTAHSSRIPLHIMESRRRRHSVPNILPQQEGKEGEESKENDEQRQTAVSASPLSHAPAAATIFRVDVRETTHYEGTTSTSHDDNTSGSSRRPANLHRRSSVLFASRVVANRSIMEGASNILLASGGMGESTSRRDLLGDRGLSSTSLRDFEMHVHPSVSKRMLSPIADSGHSGSETTSLDESSMEVDLSVMEAEPVLPEVEVVDTKSKLYSWGSGVNSLHDDSDDRTPTMEEMQVSSRLDSKSILSVSVGQYHTSCATSQGTVYVAGKNVHGCVDPNAKEGDVIARPMLLDSISNTRVLQVSCGYDHTAVLSKNGSVLTWGSNMHGQLGHRTNGIKSPTTDYKGPTNCRPAGISLGLSRKASKVVCGTNYTLVLTQQMSLLACGISSIAGHRDASQWGTPQEIPSLVGLPLVNVSAGDGHASVITAHGTAFIWGENRSGCLGRISSKALTLPVPITAPTSSSHHGNSENNRMVSNDGAILDVACGLEHSMFISRPGELLVCGSNVNGQLGIPEANLNSTHTITTVHHPTGGSFVSVEAGNSHSLVLDSSGDLWQTDKTDGLQCILRGKSVLAIAAGGENGIAITAAPKLKTLERQFSILMQEDPKTIVVTIDNLLLKMDSDPNQDKIEQEIGSKVEELLMPPILNLILNPKKLDKMFEHILVCGDVTQRQVIANSIERGMKLGLSSLQKSRLIYPEAVRCLLSYIKFFDIRRDKSIVFDVRGEAILLFCDTILNAPFEGYRALHDFATNIYSKELFISMLVKPLLLTLNSCSKFSVDEDKVSHFDPARRAVPVIVAVLSWLHAMANEVELAEPQDFYSDGISAFNTETLFDDLYRMKRTSAQERSKNFFICAHPFLLSPGCKRNLLQMESQIEQFKAMMGDIDVTASYSDIQVDPFYHLEIEREHLVKQTLEKIKDAEPENLRKRLRVSFTGEEGLDAGGVTKEFFQLLSEELFDVNSGLWSNKYVDINWFNSDNDWDENSFELIGILFGLALYNSVLLDVRFPLAVYRKILGLPLGLEDIMDEELRRGLKQLLAYEGDDVEDIFCLSFELNWMELGEEQKLELIPDGANIAVTNDNREEYVLRYVRWILVDSVQAQWNAFQDGVMKVVEDSSLDLFLPEELELLVVGTPYLDFEALKANCKYEGYEEDAPVVKNFWKFVIEASTESQVKLLKFVCASTKAPIGGLGKMDFVIQRSANSDQLPTSHTCFNTLLLPDYGDDKDKLTKLLGRAILECEGFGLE